MKSIIQLYQDCPTKKPVTALVLALVTEQSRTAVVQAILEETATCAIDIHPRESCLEAKARWKRTSLLFGSGPQKSQEVSRGVAFSASASFTSWDDPALSAFISDEELYVTGNGEPVSTLAEAPGGGTNTCRHILPLIY